MEAQPRTTPTDGANVEITFRKTRFAIAQWRNRHDHHPAICRQIDDHCDGKQHQLVFRGMKEIPYEPELFVLGLKSRPHYAAGDPDMLTNHARALAKTDATFKHLSEAFVRSPMMKKQTVCTIERLMSLWQNANERTRIRLAQLLLYGLQYQNSQQALKDWRDYLFVLSSTTKEAVAIGYGLSHKKNEAPPRRAFIIEYAAPCAGHCFERMSTVLEEFASLELGAFFRDWDSEVLIPFGMLPHYVLGYTRLDLVDQSVKPPTYNATYMANPALAHEGYTLTNPKNLSTAQADKARELNGRIAWAYHMWTGDGGEWFKLVGPSATQDISGASPSENG